jgi:hypothetical protein
VLALGLAAAYTAMVPLTIACLTMALALGFILMALVALGCLVVLGAVGARQRAGPARRPAPTRS